MGRTSDAKTRLIQNAMELIRSRSYTDVGVQELCESAGVQKGSFYHFFKSKQDLALAALDAWWDYTRKENWDPAFSPDIPPLERFERFFEIAHQQNCLDQEINGRLCGCPFGNLAIEMSTRDDKIRAKIDQIFQDIIARFEKALKDAIAIQELPILDTRKTAMALWAYCEGIILLAKSQQDPGLVEQLGRLTIQFLKNQQKEAA